jgi:lipopolysaccharide/colanic/teichoic acid biosynthesis glycosyltransferase
MKVAAGKLTPSGAPVADSSPSSGAPTWTGDYRRLRLRLYVQIILIDCLMLALAFQLASLARFGTVFTSYGLNTFGLILPIYLAIGFNGGAYSLAALADPRRSVILSARSFLYTIVVTTTLLFSLKIGEDFSRLVFGIGSLLSLLMLAAARERFGKAMGRRYGWTFRRELLLSDGVEVAARGTDRLVDLTAMGLRPDPDDPVMLQRIGELLEGAELAVIACPPERRAAWSRIMAGANVDVELLFPELDHVGAMGLRRYGGCTSLLVGHGPLAISQRASKRLLDLAISGGALIVLAPIMLLIAAAVRLESRGPALFRQERMGRGNRLFHVFKFRTMRIEASDAKGDRSASRGDDRLTRLGGFLRRTSLDELPQLINVFVGEMSIVGPRPHALGSTAENDLFWRIEDRYWDRHAIKPGMTGLAQVRGLRGATLRRADLSDRLKADLEYLDGWTLGRDLAIIARTVRVMVHRNAY